MKRIKTRRISKKDKKKLKLTGVRPVKYLFVEKKINGNRVKTRIS